VCKAIAFPVTFSRFHSELHFQQTNVKPSCLTLGTQESASKVTTESKRSTKYIAAHHARNTVWMLQFQNKELFFPRLFGHGAQGNGCSDSSNEDEARGGDRKSGQNACEIGPKRSIEKS
jgi:hypothetical protein